MARDNSEAVKIKDVIVRYCEGKNYQVRVTDKADHIRLDISEIKDRVTINVYFTRRLVVKGSNSRLRHEMEELKQKIDSNPEAFREHQEIESEQEGSGPFTAEDRRKWPMPGHIPGSNRDGKIVTNPGLSHTGFNPDEE